MNAFVVILACAALANAGGIPSYSISEIQPDRSIQVVRGLSSKSIGLSGLELSGLSGLEGLSLGGKGLGLSGLSGLGGLSLGGKGLGGLSGLSLAEPTILSAPLLSKSVQLAQPVLIQRPSIARTIITRNEPIITRLSAPIVSSKSIGLSGLELSGLSGLGGLSWGGKGLSGLSGLSGPSGLSWGRSWAQPIALAEPTKIIRSEPVLIRSEPLISRSLLKTISIAEPSLQLSDSLIGGLGGKVLLKA